MEQVNVKPKIERMAIPVRRYERPTHGMKDVMAAIGIITITTFVSINGYAIFCIVKGRNVILQNPVNIILSEEEQAEIHAGIVEETKPRRR